jgi:hypothetical protein
VPLAQSQLYRLNDTFDVLQHIVVPKTQHQTQHPKPLAFKPRRPDRINRFLEGVPPAIDLNDDLHFETYATVARFPTLIVQRYVLCD